MDSSIGKMVFCSISKGGRTLYSYNGGDHDLESLASLCLENSPPFHSWYFHTVGRRTFGFLMEDSHTYFAIVEPSSASPPVLRFLEQLRDGFKNASKKNGFHEDLVPVVRRLISSLESMPRQLPVIGSDTLENSVSVDSNDGSSSVSTKAPLLGRNGSKHDRRKAKDRELEVRDGSEDHRIGVKVEMPMEQSIGSVSLQKSSSSGRVRGQQLARRLWWRHVKIVIAVDAFLCLVLFGIWLAVCRGFSCVS